MHGLRGGGQHLIVHDKSGGAKSKCTQFPKIIDLKPIGLLQQDLLANDSINLDKVFKMSLIEDIVRVRLSRLIRKAHYIGVMDVFVYFM